MMIKKKKFYILKLINVAILLYVFEISFKKNVNFLTYNQYFIVYILLG